MKNKNFNKRLLRGLKSYQKFENSDAGHALFSLIVTGFIALIFIIMIVMFILYAFGVIHFEPAPCYRYCY